MRDCPNEHQDSVYATKYLFCMNVENLLEGGVFFPQSQVIFSQLLQILLEEYLILLDPLPVPLGGQAAILLPFVGSQIRFALVRLRSPRPRARIRGQVPIIRLLWDPTLPSSEETPKEGSNAKGSVIYFCSCLCCDLI